MGSEGEFHFGVVGEGNDATIAAFGSSLAAGVPAGEAKAWACETCTFWNTETMGRFCSMCGSRRFLDSENACAVSSGQIHQGQTTSPLPMQRFVSTRSVSEARDTVSDLPLVFSPTPEGNRKKIKSLNDMFMRGSPNNGNRTLEKSFSVFGLLDEVHVDEYAKEPSAKKPPVLSARDFQMSFANWSISDQGAWTCGACTYVNTNALHLQCEICGQNRPGNAIKNQSQKVMQDMMETSFRTGQDDFLRQQQERIEEIEERVLASKRMEELTELQAEILDDDAEFSRVDTPNIVQKAKLAEEYLDELERARKQELEEQNRMEMILQDRRRRLGMERRTTERCLQEGPITVDSQRTEVKAQERLLSQWKQSYRRKESDIAEIRRKQEEIMKRWQNGAC